MATVVHSVTSWEIGQTSLKFGSFVVPCLGVYVTCNNNTWNANDSGTLRLTSAQAQAIGAAFRASNIVAACALSCTPHALWGGTLTTETITGNNGLSVVFSDFNLNSNTQIIKFDLKQNSSFIAKFPSYATMETNGKLAYSVTPIFIDKATNRVIAGSAFNTTCIYSYPIGTPENTNVCDNKIPCVVGGTLSVGTNSGTYLVNQDVITGGKLLGEEIDPTPIPASTDPYEPGGNSDDDPTGGGGNFDGTSTPISIPGLPSLSAVDSGFITLFNPSVAELVSLCSYMWSSAFDINTFIRIFADPMDCILGLSIVPVAVPNGGSKVVKVGNIETTVSMTVAATQYVIVNCGSISVNEFWGAYLDYDPYTKAEIYLPYIGTHAISVDDIMGKTVEVEYHVDILSGACTAFVKCGDSVLYTFIGQCSSSIPITGNDWTNVINGVLTIAGSVGSMIATGGASAPLVIPSLSSTAVNGLKPNIEKSGSMSGTGGMLAIQKPYLILTRPKQALPKYQNQFMGYPSFITRKLSNVSGYTEIESVHLENISATEQELSEIENLLKGGVIL